LRVSRRSGDWDLETDKAIARAMGRDNICYMIRAPVFADLLVSEIGQRYYGDGQIRIIDDLIS
jgi:hypothetical protein